MTGAGYDEAIVPYSRHATELAVRMILNDWKLGKLRAQTIGGWPAYRLYRSARWTCRCRAAQFVGGRREDPST